LPFVYHVIRIWHVVNEPWIWMLLLLLCLNHNSVQKNSSCLCGLDIS
jgi:hypothetical protein